MLGVYHYNFYYRISERLCLRRRVVVAVLVALWLTILIELVYSENTQRVLLIIRKLLSLIVNGLYYSFQTSKFNSNI